MADVETIHGEMLAEIDDSYQKSPGFPAFDFTRAYALAAASLAGDVEAAEARQDPDNLSGNDLDLYVWQHLGLDRKYATYATATLKVVSGSGTIHEGDLFATASGVQFYATETVAAAAGTAFGVRAVEAGAAGNVSAGAISVMPVTITGIASVTNDAAASGGYDEETDAELRERFYDALQHPVNGGNADSYRQWAMSVDGVGRAVVIPTPRGANTVDVVLVAADGSPADEDLVDAVQDLIDPSGYGYGSGTAPIGAACTVSAATALDVDVAVTLTLESGATQEEVEAAVEEAIRKEISAAGLAGGTLRYLRIADAVMVDGVDDFTGLTLNGSAASVTPGTREVPVLGEVTITIA